MIDSELQDSNMMVKSGKTLYTSFVKLYHFKEISKKNMMDQKYILSSAKHFVLHSRLSPKTYLFEL